MRPIRRLGTIPLNWSYYGVVISTNHEKCRGRYLLEPDDWRGMITVGGSPPQEVNTGRSVPSWNGNGVKASFWIDLLINRETAAQWIDQIEGDFTGAWESKPKP